MIAAERCPRMIRATSMPSALWMAVPAECLSWCGCHGGMPAFRQAYCTARRYESRVYLVPGCLDDVRLRLRPGALPQDRGASPGFAEAFPRVFPQVSRRRTPPPSCLTH